MEEIICPDCSHHFTVSPSESTIGEPCPDCGGTRMFFNQPSPVHSDGDLRNTVDSDSQKDQGGNPLGEGTIMGRDGEQAPGFRDNSFPGSGLSHVLAAVISHGPLGYSDPIDYLQCPNCHSPVMADRGYKDLVCTNDQCNSTWPIRHDNAPPVGWPLGQRTQTDLENPATLKYEVDEGRPGTIPNNVDFGPKRELSHQGDRVPEVNPMSMSRTNNMDPYPSLWEDTRTADYTSPLSPTNGIQNSPFPEGQSEEGQQQAPQANGGGEGGLGEAAGGIMNKVLQGGGAGGMGSMIPGGGIAGGGAAGAGGMGEMADLAALASVFVSDKNHETPTSNPDVGVKQDDPEKVDTHEFNDQDHNPNFINPNLEDSGNSGEDEVKKDSGAGFSPDSPGIEQMTLLMPLLMHFMHSDESGLNHPMIKELHEMLLSENPHYLTEGGGDMDDQKLTQLLQGLVKPDHVDAQKETHPSDKQSKTALVPSMQAPNMFGAGNEPGGMSTVNNPMAGQQQQSCTLCGAPTANGGTCTNPQCSVNMSAPTEISSPTQFAPNNLMAHVLASLVEGANHQGPVTPEQMAAVQNWLIENGRAAEAPNVPMDPGNPEFVQVLNMITGNPNPPITVSPEEQTKPPAPQENPQGAMPMPGPAGEGSPQMQPLAAMLEAVAADNVAPRCPKCGSATTGMLMDEGGHMNCHACGNIWKSKDIVKDVSVNKESKVAEERASKTALVDGPDAAQQPQMSNPIGIPSAEQERPTNRGGDEDSSLSWKDSEGNPLLANKEYEMKNPAYQIPDVVRVKRVKPDGLEVELLGTFANEPNALQAPTTITHQELEMEHLTFEPMNENADDRNNEVPPGTPGEEHIPAQQTTDEHDNSQPPFTQSRVVGAVVEQDDDVCPHCGHLSTFSSMSSPTTIMHDCDNCLKSWETNEEMFGVESGLQDREWLNEDDDAEDFLAPRRASMREAQASRNLGAIASKDEVRQQIKEKLDREHQARTAGRKFTPGEQRTLIDERGSARNSDLLELEGTHYQSHETRVNEENVPDSHFLMGF